MGKQPTKEKLLSNSDVSPSVKMDLETVTIDLDMTIVRQFLFDMKCIEDNNIVSMGSLLVEFKEFLMDYYPKDADASYLLNFYKVIIAMELFFSELQKSANEDLQRRFKLENNLPM